MRHRILCIFAFILYSVFVSANISHIDSKINYFIRETKNQQYNAQETIAIYDSIINLFFQKRDTLNVLEYMVEKGKAQSADSRHINAYKTFDFILTLTASNSRRPEWKSYQDKALLSLAKEARRLGMYDDSVEKCFWLLENNNEEDKSQSIIAYSIISIVFMTMGNEKDAIEYSQKADHLLTKTANLNSEAVTTYWNCKAGIEFYKRNFSTSVAYIDKALKYLDETEDDPDLRIILNNNIANAYYGMKEYGIAQKSYMKNLRNMENKPNSFYKAETLWNLGRIYYENKDYTNAESYFRQCISMADSINAFALKAYALIELSNLFFVLNKDRMSRIYLYTGYQLLDSISITDNIAKLSILKNNFENREIQKDKEILMKELQILSLNDKNKKILLLTLFLMLIISISVIIVMIKRIQSNKRNNRLLVEEMADNKVTIETVKNRYDTEIGTKNEQLQILVRVMSKSHSVIHAITEIVKDISVQNDIHRIQKSTKEIQQIINNYKSDSAWHSFEDQFNDQFNNFAEQLLKIFPSLSFNEIQLCMLLATDMNAKDIASFMNKSVRTIESMIYRIRKKLMIPQNMKTNNFLKQFLEPD